MRVGPGLRSCAGRHSESQARKGEASRAGCEGRGWRVPSTPPVRAFRGPGAGPEWEKRRSPGQSAAGLPHWVLLLRRTSAALQGWAGGARGGAQVQAKAKGGLWVWGGWKGEASLKKAAKAPGHALTRGPGSPTALASLPTA